MKRKYRLEIQHTPHNVARRLGVEQKIRVGVGVGTSYSKTIAVK